VPSSSVQAFIVFVLLMKVSNLLEEIVETFNILEDREAMASQNEQKKMSKRIG
jgi:hypothetical protein